MNEENNKGVHRGPDGWHRTAKAIGIIVGLVIALFVGVTVLGIYWPDIQERRYRLESEKFEQEMNLARQKIADAERADTFGGKTPEETFDMFLSAIKNNDADLASKYYDFSVKEEAEKNLKAELSERGDLALSFKYFSDVRGGVRGCDGEIKRCTFEYKYITDKDEWVNFKNSSEVLLIKAGTEQTEITELVLNDYSKNWKIIQPL